MAGGAAAAASLSRCARTDAAPPADDAAADEEPDLPQCLHMHLTPKSTTEVLGRFPQMHENKLCERVLIRGCIEVEKEVTPLRVLAYASDGLSQSLLVALGERLWAAATPVHPGGVGYPVVPISLASVLGPTGESPAADAEAQGTAGKDVHAGPDGVGGAAAALSAAKATPAAGAAPAAEAETVAEAEPDADEDEDDTPSMFVTPAWEQAESVWRRLEASGLLELDRDDDAMPVSARLTTGGASWRGGLPGGSSDAWPVEVRVFGQGKDIWDLEARTAPPECGFCRFMKAGPCGAAFAVWEKCIEKARHDDDDFVDVCGAATLELKRCTDAHPEYYGMLGGGGDEESEEEPGAPAGGQIEQEAA